MGWPPHVDSRRVTGGGVDDSLLSLSSRWMAGANGDFNTEGTESTEARWSGERSGEVEGDGVVSEPNMKYFSTISYQLSIGIVFT